MGTTSQNITIQSGNKLFMVKTPAPPTVANFERVSFFDTGLEVVEYIVEWAQSLRSGDSNLSKPERIAQLNEEKQLFTEVVGHLAAEIDKIINDLQS